MAVAVKESWVSSSTVLLPIGPSTGGAFGVAPVANQAVALFPVREPSLATAYHSYSVSGSSPFHCIVAWAPDSHGLDGADLRERVVLHVVVQGEPLRVGLELGAELSVGEYVKTSISFCDGSNVM